MTSSELHHNDVRGPARLLEEHTHFTGQRFPKRHSSSHFFMRHIIIVILALISALILARGTESSYSPEIFTDEHGHALTYRLLSPSPTTNADEHFPLVIYLHGSGERGDDNDKQLLWLDSERLRVFTTAQMRSKHPCFVLAPQCPLNSSWSAPTGDVTSHALPGAPSESLRLTLELIQTFLKAHPVDPKRIYVTGLSMGGFGAWEIIERQPNLFAAAVPICGGGDEAQAQRIAHIPLWIFHGEYDPKVPVARSRDMVAALRAAGGQPKYTEYPHIGHDSWQIAHADPALWDWVFAQARPTDAP